MEKKTPKVKKNRNGLRVLVALLCLIPAFAIFYISAVADQTDPDTVVEEWDSSVASGAAADADDGIDPAMDPTNSNDMSIPGDGATGDVLDFSNGAGQDGASDPAADADTNINANPDAANPADPNSVNPADPNVVDPTDPNAADPSNPVASTPNDTTGTTGNNGGGKGKKSGPAVRALGKTIGDVDIVEPTDVILPGNSWTEYLREGGWVVLPEPEYNNISDAGKAKLKGNVFYVLKKSGTGGAYTVNPGEETKVAPGTYDVFIEETDAMENCFLSAENYHGDMDTLRDIQISYYPRTEGFDDITTTTRTPKNPEPVGGKTWYQSVKVSPNDGYYFLESYDSTVPVYELSYKHDKTLTDGTDVYMAKETEDGVFVLEPFTDLTQKYNIDNRAPEGSITGFAGYTGTGPYIVSDESTTSLKMTYTVNDKAATEESGKSGVVAIEYKMTNKGEGGDISLEQFNNVSQKPGMESGVCRGETEALDGNCDVTAGLNGFSDGDNIYIYSKVTDAAGNYHCFATYFGMIDYSGPEFSSTDEQINNKVKDIKDDETLDLRLLMFSSNDYRIQIRDRNLKSVTYDSVEQTYTLVDGYKVVTIDFNRPDDLGGKTSHNIVATDESGHKKTLNITCLNCQVEWRPLSQIDFGSIPYGYVLPTKEEEYTPKYEPISKKNEQGEYIVGESDSFFTVYCAIPNTLRVVGRIEIDDPTEFSIDGYIVAEEDYTEYRYHLTPKAQLDCGEHKTIFVVTCELETADSSTLVLGDPSGLTKDFTVSITVTRVPITLRYGGGRSSHSTPDGSNEFYGKRPGATTPSGEADWSDRLSVASGLKYGQTEEAVYKDKYYTKPNISRVLPIGEGVLEDGYVLGDGELYFEIKEGIASTNYQYVETKTGYDSEVHGMVHCVHDSFGRSEGADRLSYSVIGTPGRPNWYTSEVTIKNEEGFQIMNAGTVPCQYDFRTGKVSMTGATTGYVKKFSEAELTDKSIVVSRDSKAGTGVVQYFYQYDTKTGVNSDLMYEIILIDRSRPGYTWDASIGETALTELPYFRFLERAGEEVLRIAGSGLPATKSDPITLHNLEDPESGILSAQYLILSEPDLTNKELDKVTGWRNLLKSGSNYYLSGAIQENGYLYVKIANYAGLSTYLSLDEQLDFSGDVKKDIIQFDDVKIPSQFYGYTMPDPYLIPYSGQAKDGGPIYITDMRVDDGPGGGSEYFSVRSMGETGRWYITPKTGLEAGTYKGFLMAQFSNGEIRTVKIRFDVEKKPLTASYVLTKVSYYEGEYIIDDGKLEVTGFIPGEGRTDSADGTVKKAAGYVDPVCEVPTVAKTSMWVGPKGGDAKDYSFNYTGSFLVVNKRTPQEGVQWSVTSNFPTKGWATDNIVIHGGAADGSNKGRYRVGLRADGSDAKEIITLTEETNNGSISFYILDTTTGEIMGPVKYDYKIDKHPPVITGATEGTTYTENARQIVVTDTNLKLVTVNGQAQSISGGRSSFTVHPSSATERFDIYAEDEAGQTAKLSFVMIQPAEIVPTAEPGGTVPAPAPTMGPGDGSSGGAIVSSVQAQNGAPIVKVSSSDEEIKQAVLTANEMSAVNDGSNLSLRVVVRDISGEVSQSDKERAFQVLNGYTIGEYLEITVWKKVGSGEETQVFQTNSPLSLTISVPSSMQTDKADRRFAMLRLSPNATDMLKDKDKVPKKVTIYTDEFDAVYVLAYMDMPKSAKKDESDDDEPTPTDKPSKKHPGGPELGSDDQPEAGDKAPVIPTAIAFGVSLIGMIVVVAIRRNSRYEWVWVEEGDTEEKDE